ncbi:MAG: hypothetical protein IPH66_09825 [Crocinitomicaceae bacterium]|nr:hypothetical protein [Crocinitomicaceae bacterium]
MSQQIPVFKFASLRNPSLSESTQDDVEVQYDTQLIQDLATIVAGSDTPAVKLADYNDTLQAYVDSASFLKTKSAALQFQTDLIATPTLAGLQQLYDNIVIRTLTKSNTNQVYKIIVDTFITVYKALNPGTDKILIIVPQSITPSFIKYIGVNEGGSGEPGGEPAVLDELNQLALAEEAVNQAIIENVVEFISVGQVVVMNAEFTALLNYLHTDSIAVSVAKTTIQTHLSTVVAERSENKIFNRVGADNMRSKINDELDQNPSGNIEMGDQLNDFLRLVTKLETEGTLTISRTSNLSTTEYDQVLSILKVTNLTTKDALKMINTRMVEINKEVSSLIEKKTYSYIGTSWVETSKFDHAYTEESSGNNILQSGLDCDYKFPYQIADLRVVEQEIVGYLPGEIAHINNTQSGEKNTRVTRRLKRSETFESILVEDETFRETDTQSTEKYSIENAAYEAQTSANSFSVYASAAATYGPVSASLDAGYTNSNSSFSSNSSSQTEAKEVITRIVDRASHRTRSERSVNLIEEYEETVTHEIDNTAQATKSYVYRWLDKLIRGRLKNYGKRLIFEFDIAHPAHYYLSRSIKDIPSISIPADPREVSIEGVPVLTIDNITRDNYLAWATVYKADIEQPPASKIIIAEEFNGAEKTFVGKVIQIPENYKCVKATANSYYVNGWDYWNSIVCSLGNLSFAFWGDGSNFWTPTDFWFTGEVSQLALSVIAQNQGFFVNFQIECHLKQDAYKAWKIKAYNEIVKAYEKLRSDAETQMQSFDPNRPGVNPARKLEMVLDEIKRETIRKMFRCNPFWIKDNFVVGKEYNPKCCADSMNAEKVKFIETVFDWKNLTYVLHPYFYSDKNNWKELLDLSDDNPHFESFLKASYATVRVPVFRDELKELAAVNFLQFNSIANYEVVPEGMSALLDELRDNQPTLFTHDINGNELPAPIDVIDLGIFKIPTNLVMLECGNSNGIKPIGYPQGTDEPTSDVVIPKQFSPAIIADTCDPIV